MNGSGTAVRAGQLFLSIPPTVILLFRGSLVSPFGSFVRRPFPALETVPLLDLLEYHNPNCLQRRGPLVLPFSAGGGDAGRVYMPCPFGRFGLRLGSGILIALWGASRLAAFRRSSPAREIVIGEVHHPVEPREIFNPEWLTIPERGLYTGIAIFGAVGSGKNFGLYAPLRQNRYSAGKRTIQRNGGQRRSCSKSRGIFAMTFARSWITRAGETTTWRSEWAGVWKWNPLSAWWLDSYSLAYTVASLLNQLFGKGKEPFWQQAYTNLVRWIIELHRVLPEQWVTLQQVYQCAIDPDLFAAKNQTGRGVERGAKQRGGFHSGRDLGRSGRWRLGEWQWIPVQGESGREMRAEWKPALEQKLKKLTIQPRIVWEPGAGDDVRERVAAVKRWFDNDWQKLDNKIKSSIVEGVSVFLSMFDMLDVAAVVLSAAPGSVRRSTAHWPEGQGRDAGRRQGRGPRGGQRREKKPRSPGNGPAIPLPGGRATYPRSMN